MSASAFERAVEREHALAMRGLRTFALVVFVPENGDALQLPQLARILMTRVRVSDIVGRIDTDRLAVLLPETSRNAAWTFADSVSHKLAEAELGFDVEVHASPTNGPPSDGSNGTGNGHSGDLTQSGNGGNEHTVVGTSENGADATVESDESQGSPLHAVRWSNGSRPVKDVSEAFIVPLSFRKRAFDVVGSLVLLVLLSPLFLIVAIAVKLTSPGPVFFKQMRAGLGGKPFAFYKFRTMRNDADAQKEQLRPHNEKDGPIFKMRSDPRITPLGRLLRSTSIDEMPQLWNVLKGDMSLVGPRPPTLDEVEEYEPWQRQRLDLTGGLTCLWQVNGRSEIGFMEWVRMDIQYARRRGPWMDLSLLARTVGAVISRRGAW